MAEVFVDMAGGGMNRDDSAQELKQQEQLPIPDFFSRLRPLLLREDGTPRTIVAAAPRVALAGVLPGALFIAQFPSNVAGREKTNFQLGTDMLWVAMFSLPAVFPPLFARAIAADSGVLALLGQGDKRVPASQVRALRRWSYFLAVPAAVILVAVVLLPVDWWLGLCWALVDVDGFRAYMQENEPNERQVDGKYFNEHASLGCFMMPVFIFNLGIGAPAIFGWYLALKVGVVLAQGEVVEVVTSTTPEAIADDERWTTTVAQPTIRLATHTMLHLSSGWGTGVGVAFILCWLYSGVMFIRMVHEIWRGDPDYNVVYHALPLMLAALAPIMMAKDVAHVSSLCDRLVNAINDLRLSWPSTKDAQTVHERAFPLQYTLRSMNNSQGLGFCVFGKVVDKKTLNVIGISVVSFVSTAVPLLMAVLVPDAVAREGECALTELEASTIRAVMSNESCSYNMTLDAILAGPGH